MARFSFWKDHSMTMWAGTEREQGEDEKEVDAIQIIVPKVLHGLGSGRR
jgi:hypothetical protein